MQQQTKDQINDALIPIISQDASKVKKAVAKHTCTPDAYLTEAMETPALDIEALSQNKPTTQTAPQEVMTPMIYHNIATAPQDFPTATMVQGVLLHTGKKKKEC